MEVANSIRRFVRKPAISPAAWAAAQLIALNDVLPDEVFAAVELVYRDMYGDDLDDDDSAPTT